MDAKRFAHVKDGVITETIVADDAFVSAHSLDWIECPEEFGIGHLYDPVTGFSHPPAVAWAGPRLLTKLAFLRRMTQEERIAFRQAAKVNPVMEDFMALLDLAMDVDLDDPDVVKGLQAAEAGGLLASGRTAEILA